MKEGTIQSLKAIVPSGFDFNTSLFMKPSPEIEDFAFKKQFLRAHRSDLTSQMLAYIDNESPTCQFVGKIFPKSIIVHYVSFLARFETFLGYSLASWL